MAETLFDTSLGYSVSDDATGLSRYEFVVLTGVPGDPGLTAEQLALSNAAPQGSEAVNVASGLKYWKKGAGSGSDKWELLPKLTDISLAVGGDSWQEPARIKDDAVYADLTAATAAINAGAIQGVTLANGDRILFTGIAGQDQDVFTVTGTPGAGATLVQDGGPPGNNEVILIDEGDHAGREFHYSITETRWVRSNESTLNEQGFIRGFIGKAASGAELPDYSSVNYINDSDTLVIAVGKLDAQVALNAAGAQSANSAAATNLAEINALEAAIGAAVSSGGAYVPFTTANYLNGNGSVTDDLLDLDAQLKSVADQAQATQTAQTSLIAEVDNLETSLGALVNTAGVYQPFSGTNYINGNASLAADLLDLDTAVKANSDAVAAAGTAVTAAQAEIDALETSFGALVNASGVYQAYSGTNYLDGAGSVYGLFSALDGQIKTNADAIATGARVEAHVAGVTALTEIDSVLVDAARSVEWLVDARQGNKVRSFVVYATHDGTTTADALKAGWDRYAKQAINGSIPGFDIDVVLQGAGTSQKLVLQATAAGATDVSARRVDLGWV